MLWSEYRSNMLFLDKYICFVFIPCDMIAVAEFQTRKNLNKENDG